MFQITGLTDGQEYFFVVRAEDSAGKIVAGSYFYDLVVFYIKLKLTPDTAITTSCYNLF